MIMLTRLFHIRGQTRFWWKWRKWVWFSIWTIGPQIMVNRSRIGFSNNSRELSREDPIPMLILILVMKVHNGTLHKVVDCISSWEESKRVMETLLFCLFMIQYYTVHGLLKSMKSTSPKKSSIVENEDCLKQLISYFISLPSMYSLNSPLSIPTWPFKSPQ